MMKQIFFSLFFATLACAAFAQNYKVNVSSTSGSYSTSKTVSFQRVVDKPAGREIQFQSVGAD